MYLAILSMLAYCVRPIYTIFFFLCFVHCCSLLFCCCVYCHYHLPFSYIWLHQKLKLSPPQTKNRKTASLHKKLTKNEKIKIKYTQKYTHTPSPTCAQQRYDRSTFLFEFEINSCACHVIDRNMFFLLVFSLFARWKPKISQCARGIFDCPTLRCFVFIQCE